MIEGRRSFTTAGVRERDRVECWRAWLSNEFQPVAIDDYKSDTFYVNCEFREVDSITITSFKGSEQAFGRPQSLIRSFHADSYVVVVSGPGAFRHNGHDLSCREGDVILFDATKPYKIGHLADTSVLSVTIPRHILDKELPEADLAIGLILDGRSGAARIIKDTVGSLARNSDLLKPATAKRMSRATVDLITAGFAEKFSLTVLSQHGGNLARVIRVRAFIDENLGNPNLNVALIAASTGISSRRLYQLFAVEPSSIGDYIWEKRLLRANKIIEADPLERETIMSIAAQVGFLSAAHFARRYKARFRMSPTEYREIVRTKFFGA